MLTEQTQGRVTLAAVDALAEASGLVPGLPLADARALQPDLETLTHEPVADGAALRATSTSLGLKNMRRYGRRGAARLLAVGHDSLSSPFVPQFDSMNVLPGNRERAENGVPKLHFVFRHFQQLALDFVAVGKL